MVRVVEALSRQGGSVGTMFCQAEEIVKWRWRGAVYLPHLADVPLVRAADDSMPDPRFPQLSVATVTDEARFRGAIAAIDAANGEDPNRLVVRGETRPKELAHAELLTEWVLRLRPDASEALLLAARAHHIERWRVPRSSYPDGRQGYLSWRRALHDLHAERAAEILRAAGYDAASIDRTRRIIRKERLKTDPEAQTLEDGLCLVFLETQLDLDWERIDDEKMVAVLRKTWRKMSAAGRDAALALRLGERAERLVRRALGAS